MAQITMVITYCGYTSTVAIPLCSPASDRTREAAMALLREAYVEYPAMLAYAKVRV